MLEKAPRKVNVSKLYVILFFEADFNALHEIVFNTRILPSLERDMLILDEIISNRHRQSALQVTINKKVILDISNQKKVPSITISADATNCYDRVVYSFTSFTVQHFSIHFSYLLILF